LNLTVLVPERIVLDAVQVSSIVAEGREGSFGLLPRHIDYIAALRPGILVYTPTGGDETYLGVDRGVLVKRGPTVMVSVRQAVQQQGLETLRATVEARFLDLDVRERQARSALATLETRFLRRFVEQASRAER
jgi:F-type H+-transporting ATPase subunit epsilon